MSNQIRIERLQLRLRGASLAAASDAAAGLGEAILAELARYSARARSRAAPRDTSEHQAPSSAHGSEATALRANIARAVAAAVATRLSGRGGGE